VSLREDPKLNDIFYSVRNQALNKFYNFTTRNINILSNLVQLAISAFVIIQFNWLLFLIYIILNIPNLLVNIKYSQKVWGIWGSETPYRRLWAVLWDLLYQRDDLQEIKINRTGPKILNKMQSFYDKFFEERSALENKKLKAQIFTLVLSQGASVLLYYILIKQVIGQDIAIGTFTFYISSLTIFKNSVSLFVGYISNQYQDTFVVKQLFDFLDLKNVITSKIGSPKVPITAPLVEFKNVSFHYPHNKQLIFNNLNLTINPGEKVAIVGVNGAGKSSLMKLLLRFYDVTEGEILVNGVNIKDIDLDSYYDLIGVLFQNYINYQFLVKDAIAAAALNEEANIELAIKSARESGANLFIEQYGEQYETQLGKEFEKGIDPSVGQWQKLAMARTFYKNPKLYILDEPTSSIDAEAEERIFESVAALPKDISVILISHRFSTVRHADTIVVLEDGKIIEQGTHEDLMKIKGRYFKLFTIQAKGYQ
jgi:ABC-type multidrug transport system fused ATPase/permease subunit